MTTRWKRTIRLLELTMVLCLVQATGCGSHKVNPDVAEKTLRTAMDSWKSGQTPDSLQKAAPSIIVQDVDWMGGARLLDYQVLPDGKPVDANLYSQVLLKLKDANGVEQEKTVTYVVGTSPKLTVFRDMTR